MKVLITGSNGQLGKSLLHTKPSNIELIETSKNILDLSNKKSIFDNVHLYKPDWVINCGAYTAVDKAETEADLAFKINGLATKYFSSALNQINGKILQISTDFVFNGKQGYPFHENQEKCPINIYGKSKALGEDLIENFIVNKENYNILRTSWVISPYGKNFVSTIIKLHSQKEKIDVVYDQVGAPTCAKNLAITCWEIIKLRDNRDLPQILHWCDSGVTSWYDIAVAIGEIGLEIGLLKKIAFVNPIKSTEFNTLSNRPNFSRLETTKTSKILGLNPNHWRSNLKLILLEILKNTKNQIT